MLPITTPDGQTRDAFVCDFKCSTNDNSQSGFVYYPKDGTCESVLSIGNDSESNFSDINKAFETTKQQAIDDAQQPAAALPT